ncbi:MAG: sulfite oxidase [Ilumatobacteraceae bacterium]|nr:sulfite oxidase [Ilumatobacteraceae bacterium]MCU1387810.1 sulfite oxidase [Ilumatobacteraceae bacterium]
MSAPTRALAFIAPARDRVDRLVSPVTSRVTRWRDERLAEPKHGDRVAAILGIALGACFMICFVTGLLSHLIQHPPTWFTWTARPAGLYRVTQGLHVATGVASIPLLFAKLWSVFPRLFQWPLFKDPLHLLERLSLLPLVGGAIFLVVTGVANIELWYPWVFFFPAGHYAIAIVTMGALFIHVYAKIRITRRVLRRGAIEPAVTVEPTRVGGGRRQFIGVAVASSAGLVLATVGQTISPLRKISILAPRRPDTGVQGFPVNKTAIEAGVTNTAQDPNYSVIVQRGSTMLRTFTIDEIRAMPMRTATLPIACVEGWSANRVWTGVQVRALVELAGGGDVGQVSVESLQRGGRYRRSILNRGEYTDEDTLLAVMVDGESLAPDHGYPLRLIAPNRPGVLQTKWVTKLVLS